MPVINKRKIINDPVYGFIAVPNEFVFDLIEHSWFQRLRYIHQLGLTNLVYPGAQHTRFQHALGAMHLMMEALEVLKNKGITITEEESEAVTIAVLLHDIGHGPFSHTLENILVKGISHEQLSVQLMSALNDEFDNRLELAISIFKNQYAKKFLHQLVSSQLDMDRLDYLNRDSFFTGVAEGVIGYDRIIKMLNVADDELVVEEKGIYSIEKFLVSRRLMYWQVYLHKTVLSAELMLVRIIERAQQLVGEGKNLFASPSLLYFLQRKYSESNNDEMLNYFTGLDDSDILSAIKVWQQHEDDVLSFLSKHLIKRKLFAIQLQENDFDVQTIQGIKESVLQNIDSDKKNLRYYLLEESTFNHAYRPDEGPIKIRKKDGTILNLDAASGQLNVNVLTQAVVKKYICYPKELKI
jgi:HD superfamily phosphohydrolase